MNTLKSLLKGFEKTLASLREEQDKLPRKIKSLEKKYAKLTELAYDENASRFDSGTARVDRNTKLGPELNRKKALRDALPGEINAKELEVVKARNELRALEEEVAKVESSGKISLYPFILLTSIADSRKQRHQQQDQTNHAGGSIWHYFRQVRACPEAKGLRGALRRELEGSARDAEAH